MINNHKCFREMLEFKFEIQAYWVQIQRYVFHLAGDSNAFSFYGFLNHSEIDLRIPVGTSKFYYKPRSQQDIPRPIGIVYVGVEMRLEYILYPEIVGTSSAAAKFDEINLIIACRHRKEAIEIFTEFIEDARKYTRKNNNSEIKINLYDDEVRNWLPLNNLKKKKNRYCTY